MGGYRSNGISIPSAGTYNPSDNFSSAQKLFMGIADRVESRAKNKAINELLQTTPTVGNGETSASQSPMAFQNQQQAAMAQIPGVSPLEALNLSSAQSKPYFTAEANDLAQSNSDRTFNQNVANDLFSQGIQNAELVQSADEAHATAKYREDVIAGAAADRDATSQYRTDTLKQKAALDDVNQFKIFNEDGSINEDNLQSYRKYKSTNVKPLDPTTQDKNKASTVKVFDDILFKSLGEDGYKKYQQLPVGDKSRIFDNWKSTGAIGYGVTDDGMFSDTYGITIPKDAAQSQFKYVGSKAFTMDGTRSPENDK